MRLGSRQGREGDLKDSLWEKQHFLLCLSPLGTSRGRRAGETTVDREAAMAFVRRC